MSHATSATDAAHRPRAEWSAILVDAVQKPGVIAKAYQLFWNYSTGNQLLCLFQCAARGIEPGPIHTFIGWKELGRHVKKHERAITLCMPVTVKRKNEVGESLDVAQTPNESVPAFTLFVYKPHWFVLSQTQGADYQPALLPLWEEQRSLETLAVERIPFRHPSGNCQGYAHARQVAVSPIAFAPQRTLFHELAHVVLGHTQELEQLDDHDLTPRNLREVEAECVALICCESLNLGGYEYSRGYIQHWLAGESLPEKSAQRIFKAADAILKAGLPQRLQA